MRNPEEIRRRNLMLLIEEEHDGKQTRFAEAMEFKQPNLVSRYLSVNPKTQKPIGNKLARRIELRHGKPEFWMDTPRGGHADQERNLYIIKPKVPVVSWVQAGNWSEIIDNFQPGEADEWIDCPVACSNQTFVLRVRGASMEPRFMDGDYIFVDPHAEARNRSFVVVRLDDDKEATFKQLIIEGDRRYLKPVNPHWPDPIITIDGRATICGVVIFRGEKL